VRTTCRSSAPRSRQITTPALYHSISYRPDALPNAQPTVSKHQRHCQSVSILVSHPYLVQSATNASAITTTVGQDKRHKFLPARCPACHPTNSVKTVKDSPLLVFYTYLTGWQPVSWHFQAHATCPSVFSHDWMMTDGKTISIWRWCLRRCNFTIIYQHVNYVNSLSYAICITAYPHPSQFYAALHRKLTDW